ncbi:DnaJ subfamily C member 7 [Carex littledalei]|uniref:DnaJ subfamily C member 7 n=1 Tax=Carex littledalei TaxID=544730 RepID=A0A833RAW2_9POAL|nr:DnaJ subfamily C member 7 [Carex littledalei]
METPTSSSEFHLHQVGTKTKMPLETTSFTGLATTRSPNLFQPTSPTSTRSSFGVQSSINPGKSSELRFSIRSARSNIPGPFALHSESPSQAKKENADSLMVGSSSDMARISWKDYIPEINREVSRVNLGEQSVKSNVENVSKDLDPDIKHQFKGSYRMPRTDSAQSFGSVFNLNECIPEKTQEESKQGTGNEGENTDVFSFSDYINLEDQFGDFRARPREKSTESFGAQSLGSGFNFQEFISEVTQDASRVKLGKPGGKDDVQNQSIHGLFSSTTGTGGKNIDSLSFGNYDKFKNQFGESHEMPVVSSIQSVGTQSLGLNANKLRERVEKLSVQNLSNDGLFSGTGTGGVKTESLFFKDYINLEEKSDKAIEMPPTNSTEKLGTQHLGLGSNFEELFPQITQHLNTIHLGEHLEIPIVEEKSKEGLFLVGNAGEGEQFKALHDNTKFGDRFKELYEMPPTNLTETLCLESILSGSKFDDFLPETTQVLRKFKMGEQFGNVDVNSQSKDDRFIFSSASQDEGTRLAPYDKGKKSNSTSIESSFLSPVGSFAFTSKYGRSENKKKEIKGPRRRYIKIQKKGEQTTQAKKIGEISEERQFNFEESFGSKPKNTRGDASYSNRSSENTPLFSTSTGDAKINGTNFLFSEATYLDPDLFKRNSETTQLDGFFTRTRTDVPRSFSGSKNSGQMPLSLSELHYGKKNMSKIGNSSFAARSAPMQLKGPELLKSFSLPPEQHRLRSKEVHEFPNIGKYGTSRSSGMDNDGEKWHARGNEVYEKGDMKSAEEFYTRGIKSLASGETYQSRNRSLVLCYSNRAAVRMSLGQISEALSDCLAASKIDPAFPKVQLQIANCLVDLGDLEEAIKQFNRCLESNNYENLDPAILSEASSGLNKAHLRRYEDAIQYCEQIPDSDGKDYISKQWRLNIIAKSYFYLGKLDEALEVIKRNEQAAKDFEPYENKFPEHDTSFIVTLRKLARLKDAGNEAFHAGQYTEAVEHYSAAIACSKESCFFTAVCLCNCAATYQALGQIVDAIADCSLAIALDPTYTKVFSRRAGLYYMIRDYNQAANDLRVLISLLEKQQQENQAGKPSKTNITDDLNRARRRLLSAEESAQKRIPLNLYLILGVEESASVDDVENAYEKAALRHHPDNAIQSVPKNDKSDGDPLWTEVTGRVHKDADHLFKIIGEAYAVLSDTSKRAKYDCDEEKWRTKKTRRAVRTPRKSALGR